MHQRIETTRARQRERWLSGLEILLQSIKRMRPAYVHVGRESADQFAMAVMAEAGLEVLGELREELAARHLLP